MLGVSLDLTKKYNDNSSVVAIDLSGYDWCTIQLVGLSAGTITFSSTNDDGAITGVESGNATLATNWIAIQATNLNTGTAATTATAAGLYRVPVIGRFLQISGAGVTISQILLYLQKIA